ncbi:hypothetical protein [Curtobacterium sp. MCBD17_040]|uniref:hypothetical protein n=1 Tax=Curtobacterium sp. MCBD17_040 TaxID=2175674 RepID=UPI000DA91826|nr:hypothetical protein [Curtobacterium sp. MCBD17_040]WIB64877.1 hypothetical protein DEI94_06755 [Curtobacterium sp. MCBD17_040]
MIAGVTLTGCVSGPGASGARAAGDADVAFGAPASPTGAAVAAPAAPGAVSGTVRGESAPSERPQVSSAPRAGGPSAAAASVEARTTRGPATGTAPHTGALSDALPAAQLAVGVRTPAPAAPSISSPAAAPTSSSPAAAPSAAPSPAASAASSTAVVPPRTPISMIGTPAWVPVGASPSPASSGRGKGISPGGLYENTINTMSASAATAVFADMRSTGATWVRLDYNYAGNTTRHGGATTQTITAARSAGLDVLVILGDGTAPMPESAGYKAAGGWMTSSVTQLAALGVHTFEIGNEVNLGANWGGTPDPAAYTALLETVYPMIHAADPKATVLMAGMAPYGKESPTRSAQGSNYHPFDFIDQMYEDGARGSFDALNLHPYVYPAMPATSDGGYNVLSVLPDLLAIMSSNGDSAKKIWITEAGMPTGTEGGYPAYTVAQQQQTITQLFQVATKYPQLGPVFLYDWQDGGIDGDFGLYTSAHVKKPSYATFAGISY